MGGECKPWLKQSGEVVGERDARAGAAGGRVGVAAGVGGLTN